MTHPRDRSPELCEVGQCVVFRTGWLHMLTDLTPTEVAWWDSRRPLPKMELHAAEQDVISGASAKRRHDFSSVRACASKAFELLGATRPPLVPGVLGSPSWPAGFVGSLTHTTGYCAAVVARSSAFLGLGIDAERHVDLPPEVVRHVISPEEAIMVAQLVDAAPEICWDTVIFSAKESIYKLWSPLTGRWLGFSDATVRCDLTGSFTATITLPGAPGQLREVQGKWRCQDSLVVTCVALRRDP